MNGDNVGRIEGERRDPGLNRDNFGSNFNNIPVSEDYPQEEHGVQEDVPTTQEVNNDVFRNRGINKRVVNSAVAVGLVGGLVGGGAAVANTQEDREKRGDNISPVTEQYNEDMTQESAEDKQEFSFLDSSIGSGLDSEGLVKESVGGEGVEQPRFSRKFKSGERLQALVPRVESLKRFELVDVEKLDAYRDFRVASDYINVYSFPLRHDLFPGKTFTTTTIDTSKFLDYINSPRRLGEGHNLKDLEGLGFSVHNIITMEGPEGEKIKLGEYHSLFGWYEKSYLLLDYTSEGGEEYIFASDNFDDLDEEDYGKSRNSFLELSHQISKGVSEGTNLDRGVQTEVSEVDSSLMSGVIEKLYDVQNLRDLQEIAKENMSIRVILGITNAINSYPGDEVVNEEYLEEMFRYNKQTYNFDPVGLENEEARPEKLTKYLLNYVDDEGVSWYRDYLEFQKEAISWYNQYFETKRHPKGYSTYYPSETALIRDLNRLSSGVKIEGRPVQAFGLSDLYMNLIGVPTSRVSAAQVSSVRELIPEDIVQLKRGFYNSVLRRTYVSPNFDSFEELRVGDRLIARDVGPVVPITGKPAGHMVTVFYESMGVGGETIKWVFDIDGTGKVRLYQWNNNDGKRMYDVGFLKSMYEDYHLLRYGYGFPPSEVH